MERERVKGMPQGPCWCVTESFPPELIAALPADARNKACICAGCLAAFHRQQVAS
jgi:hypothetical protein